MSLLPDVIWANLRHIGFAILHAITYTKSKSQAFILLIISPENYAYVLSGSK